jgi:peptide/nickel transport system substrate-binding protein
VSAVRGRWLVAAVVLLVAGAVAWATLGPGWPRPAGTGGRPAGIREGGTVTFAGGEPTGFNINTSKDSGTFAQDVVGNVYPSVFRIHPDLSVRLDAELMESAELTAERPQTVTYRIRPAAAWSDGTPIGVDDFEYLWGKSNGSDERIDVASTTGYRDIGSVTGSPDGKAVTVVFARPFAEWRSLFINLLPAHYVERRRGGWNTGLDGNPERIPSGGPFRIARHDKGQSLTLERNPGYWGRPAHLDRIVIRFLADAGAQGDALENGEVDVIYPRPEVDVVRTVQKLPNVASRVNFGLSFEHLTLNLRDPVLADRAVRRAIALAVDRRQLLERTVGLFSDQAQVLGNRIWLPGQRGYADHSGGYGRGNVAAAAALLERAGWTVGAGGVRVKDGRRLSLRYSTTQGVRLREQTGVLLKGQLAKAGVELELRPVGAGTLFGDLLPNGSLDIAAFSWIGGPFAVSGNRDIYATGGGGNYGRFSDPQVDALFDQATAELNQARSTALANQIDRRLWEGLPNIPLYQRPTFIAWRGTLRNVVDNPSLEGPLWNAEDWAYAAGF